MEKRGREPGCFWKASVVPWFRGFCQPPHELQPELGRCLDPFWMPLFSPPPPSVGMTRGQTMLGFRLLPSPASLEPNRSIWDVGNKNLTDNVAPLSTMEWPPRIACRDEVTEVAVDARRPRHLDKTPCGLCGLSAGEGPFFFLSVRLPWPNIPPRCNAGCHGTNARRTHHHAPRPEPSWSG